MYALSYLMRTGTYFDKEVTVTFHNSWRGTQGTSPGVLKGLYNASSCMQSTCSMI